MKSKKVKILINGRYLETVANEEVAKARIATYERMDRYEVTVEGYGMPHGFPVYTIEK